MKTGQQKIIKKIFVIIIDSFCCGNEFWRFIDDKY